MKREEEEEEGEALEGDDEDGEELEVEEEVTEMQEEIKMEEEEEEEEELEEEEEDFSMQYNHTNRFYCELCDTSNSSMDQLQMHFAGSKHKKKLEVAGLSSKLIDYVERPKNVDIWNQTVRCLLCKVIMMGSECLIHNESTEHQKKLTKMSQRNQDFYSDISNCFRTVETTSATTNVTSLTSSSAPGPTSAPLSLSGREMGGSLSMHYSASGRRSYECGMCKLHLSDKEHLKLHLDGKKHQKRVRWMRLSAKEGTNSEMRQVWCSLCHTFVTNKAGFESHIRGRSHVRVLRSSGVPWRVLAEAYGESIVGAEPSPSWPPNSSGGDGAGGKMGESKRHKLLSSSSSSSSRSSSRDSKMGRSHDRNSSRRRGDWMPSSLDQRHTAATATTPATAAATVATGGSGSNHLPSSNHQQSCLSSSQQQQQGDHHSHTSTSFKQDNESPPPPPLVPPDNEAMPLPDSTTHRDEKTTFIPLPHPKWASAYSAIPDYNPTLPRLLRNKRKPPTEHRVIFQQPLMAVGHILDQLNLDDPRFGEMDQRIRSSTQEREVKDREREREERREEERERGRGFFGHGRDSGRFPDMRGGGRGRGGRSFSEGGGFRRSFSQRGNSRFGGRGGGGGGGFRGGVKRRWTSHGGDFDRDRGRSPPPSKKWRGERDRDRERGREDTRR